MEVYSGNRSNYWVWFLPIIICIQNQLQSVLFFFKQIYEA